MTPARRARSDPGAGARGADKHSSRYAILRVCRERRAWGWVGVAEGWGGCVVGVEYARHARQSVVDELESARQVHLCVIARAPRGREPRATTSCRHSCARRGAEVIRRLCSRTLDSNRRKRSCNRVRRA